MIQIPLTIRLKVFNSIGFLGMAAFLIGLGFVPSSKSMLGIIILVCAISVLGFNTGGFFKSVILVSKQYSPTILGLVHFVTFMAMIIGPFLKLAVVKRDEDISQWRILFFILASALFFCNGVFCLFGSGEAAKWALVAVEPLGPEEEGMI